MSRRIPLTQGKHAIVDDEDFERVNQFKWYPLIRPHTIYVMATPRGKAIYIHRFIINAPKGVSVDHIDGNGLNNKKSNLRLATALQQQGNRRGGENNISGYKGVYWKKSANRWQALTANKGKQIWLGNFDNRIEAAKAYNRFALKKFGRFAKLNIIVPA